MRLNNLLLIAYSISILGGAPIPPEQSISAHIVSTLSIPAGQTSMHMPTAVALDSKQNVFVADGANDRIVRFDAGGGPPTIIKPDLKQPAGLFVDADDQLWIADSGNHRVVKLDGLGNIKDLITLPAGKDRPAKPTDLLLLPDGSRMYVVDNDNHRLLVRDQKTKEWKTIGEPGTSVGQFQYPFMIARGNDNDIVVTEAIGARGQILSKDDRWVGQISEFGIELGQLYRPKGIAVDRDGRVFISDSTLQVVQVFSAQGVFAGILTDDQHQPLRFKHPMGLRFDSAGRLFVVELNADRAAVVELTAKRGGAP